LSPSCAARRPPLGSPCTPKRAPCRPAGAVQLPAPRPNRGPPAGGPGTPGAGRRAAPPDAPRRRGRWLRRRCGPEGAAGDGFSSFLVSSGIGVRRRSRGDRRFLPAAHSHRVTHPFDYLQPPTARAHNSRLSCHTDSSGPGLQLGPASSNRTAARRPSHHSTNVESADSLSPVCSMSGSNQ